MLVRPACWPADLATARSLLHRYFIALAEDERVPATIRSRNREPELDSLQTLYDTDVSPLLLAFHGDHPAGCVTVRWLKDRDRSVEMKRLFVLPEARGTGVGRTLALAAIDWSRARGATELLLDTLPLAMAPALRLYRSLGFEPTTRYNDNVGNEFAFFRLPL